MNGKPDKGTSWGNVADWYDGLLEASADSYQAQVILPNLTRIMDLKAGMNVLDIACGQGYFTRTFLKDGVKVTGCDISVELIALAQSRSPKEIEFKVNPAHSLPFASSDSIDVATVILAIQNIDNLIETFLEVSRTLKVGGRLILVLNHPAFRIPKHSGWEWDEVAGKQFRRVDAYLSDSRIDIDMTPGERNPLKKKSTVSFHRPLQGYFKAFARAGLAVSRLEEWISHKKSQPGPRGAEEDRIRKEIPMFLMLEAVKLHSLGVNVK